LPAPPFWLILVLAVFWALIAVVGLIYQFIYWRGLWPTWRRLRSAYLLRAKLAQDQVAYRRMLAMQTNLETQGAIFGIHALFALTAVLGLANLPHAALIWGATVSRLILVLGNLGLIWLTYRCRRREPEILRLRTTDTAHPTP
jgi:hypothetical protein